MWAFDITWLLYVCEMTTNLSLFSSLSNFGERGERERDMVAFVKPLGIL